jgi:alcohol dehydrogenase class IV
LEQLIVGKGVLARLPEEIRRHGYKKAFVLADANTFAAAGERVEALLVQEKIHGLYMVVYRKTSTAVATHPWTQYAWIKQYSPWCDMTQNDWEKAVREFIRL